MMFHHNERVSASSLGIVHWVLWCLLFECRGNRVSIWTPLMSRGAFTDARYASDRVLSDLGES